MSKPKTRPPFRSGFCGIGNPPDSHTRCHGSYDDSPCVCDCHTAPAILPADVESPQMTMGPDDFVVLPPTDPSDRFYGAVLELRTHADDLNETSVKTLDWETAVRALHNLEMARKTLQVVEAALTSHIATVGREAGVWKGVAVEGVGVIRVGRGKDRKTWEHDALVKRVIDTHMSELGGEVPDPYTVAGWLTEAAHVDYWRGGKLAALDIPVDEFCETTRGRLSAQITSNDTIGATT